TGICLNCLLKVSERAGETLRCAPVPEITPGQVSLVGRLVYLVRRTQVYRQLVEHVLYDVTGHLNLDGNDFLGSAQVGLISSAPNAGSVFHQRELIGNDQSLPLAPRAPFQYVVRLEPLTDLVKG